MSFFIVSGLSGSGKTIALQALEDIGFYCIDNLPAALLPHFASLVADMRHNAIVNVAIGLDVRNRAFLADLPQSLEQLHARGIHYIALFDTDYGADDIREDPEGWGLQEIARGFGARLYKDIW